MPAFRSFSGRLRGRASFAEGGLRVDGSRLSRDSRTVQHRSGQPCVRPIHAAHKAAGHNAFRGSGPGQKLAFDNAVAQVECPDRRIDQSCITCCLPFPTVPTAPPRRYFLRPGRLSQRDWLLVTLALGRHGPNHPPTPGIASSRLSGSLAAPGSETKKPPPIREAAFASLKAPLRPVPAPVDPTGAREGGEASGR